MLRLLSVRMAGDTASGRARDTSGRIVRFCAPRDSLLQAAIDLAMGYPAWFPTGVAVTLEDDFEETLCESPA